MLEAHIGLEIHVELKTREKMFCACENTFDAAPNTHCCPVCLALPGALPTINREAVRLALRAALAFNCSISRVSRFDRKQYSYPDLPKGYQITQFFSPFCSGGEAVLPSGRVVRIHHIHLEEDAGKLLHGENGTLVNLNRCGVPLIEIVTQPDMTSAEDACALLRLMRETLVALQVTDGRMQEGSMRADVNVSVAERGAPLGERVELKNMSGFRLTRRAIEYEIARQRAMIEQGQRVCRETRRWNEQQKQSELMRDKESLPDYRYMPEPDLPPLFIEEDMMKEAAQKVCAYQEEKKAKLLSAEAEIRKKEAAKQQKAAVAAQSSASLPEGVEDSMRQILTDNPNIASDYHAGKTKVLAYPMGLLIKRFQSVNPLALKNRLLSIMNDSK